MGQPYPMEFLLTPGKVTIVIEAYQQVRHIYTDGRPLPEDPGSQVPRHVDRPLGRRHARRGNGRLLAAHRDHPLRALQRQGAHRRTIPPQRSRHDEHRDDDHGSRDAGGAVVSTRTLRRHRNWTTAEYICEENNRNFVDSTGKAGIDLTLPGTKK